MNSTHAETTSRPGGLWHLVVNDTYRRDRDRDRIETRWLRQSSTRHTGHQTAIIMNIYLYRAYAPVCRSTACFRWYMVNMFDDDMVLVEISSIQYPALGRSHLAEGEEAQTGPERKKQTI